MIKQSNLRRIKAQNLQYLLTTFENKGDILVSPIKNNILFESYNRFHVCHKGTFNLTTIFNGEESLFIEEKEAETLRLRHHILPHKEVRECDSLRITSLLDDSSYYCIMPLNPDTHKICKKEIFFKKGDEIEITAGTYSCNVDINIENRKIPAREMFSLFTDNKTFLPPEDGKIVQFYTVRKQTL
jgi:hypothetical protein